MKKETIAYIYANDEEKGKRSGKQIARKLSKYMCRNSGKTK